MARPTYGAISNHCRRSEPAIVFVPTRKHAKLTSLDLIAFAAAEGEPDKFVQVEESDLAPYLAQISDQSARHALAHGVALVHEAMREDERKVIEKVFAMGAASVLVATAPLAWGLTAPCKLVVIAGTQYYDAGGAGAADYPVTDLLQMMGRASRPGIDDAGVCVLLCHAPRKEYYKKFLFEPFPVESHLDHFLHDPMVAEIVTRTIETKQDAVDYITWSFYYRRLTQNPNYYNLTGVSHRHLSDALSELVETTLGDLEASKCISIEDEMDCAPLNLGMISAYYYITYTTIELFAASLTAKTKLKGLLEIVAGATEFETFAVRPGEAETLRRILNHAPITLSSNKTTDPHVKVAALLQAHFGRQAMHGDFAQDLQKILPDATRLLQAMVDVIASNGWLGPALAAMELSQMLVQGMWDKDPAVMQLPHVTREIGERCVAAGVEGVYDLIDMEDDARRDLLELSDGQLEDVAEAANRYPSVEVAFDVVDPEDVTAGDAVEIIVNLEREHEGDVGPVFAPRYPGRKEEGWWLVVGDAKKGTLHAIKRVSLGKKQKVKLEFAAPERVGPADLTLYLMADSYLGCDQEYEFTLDVKEGEDESDDDAMATEG